jgi:class 3 adenylate cyclase
MASTRRLTAIFAADVAGYSRLMGVDDEGTHERLKAHLHQLVDPKIKEHRGRTVKNTGDGLLAEFASVVDAVRCAAEVQRAMIDREPEVTDERRIRFRIGVNLGDIIADGDDIFGDGVNVAARLEALAEPGVICISRTVREQIRDKLTYQFEDLGEQSIKNIARPVRVYTLRPEVVASLPAASLQSAESISQSAAAPRLSIVVLPFTNLSNDPEQQYRRWNHRGSDDRSVAARRHVRDLAQYRVHLSRQAGRHKADRPRACCALCAGRQRPSVGQPGPRQRPADRYRDRRASVGGALRPRHERSVRPARRDHQPDRGYAQP